MLLHIYSVRGPNCNLLGSYWPDGAQVGHQTKCMFLRDLVMLAITCPIGISAMNSTGKAVEAVYKHLKLQLNIPRFPGRSLCVCTEDLLLRPAHHPHCVPRHLHA